MRFAKRFAINALVLAAVTVVCACSSDRIVTTTPSNPTERSLAGAKPSATYVLNAGDRVRVSVFDLTTTTGEFTIDEAGTIAVPPLEPLVVKQLTPKEAADALTNAFFTAGLYRKARVTIDVISYGRFYVLGEVSKPGEFEYRPGMSLFAAVATAGGHTYRANKGRVLIRRASDAIETEYEYTSDMAILPGDVIRVPELHL